MSWHLGLGVCGGACGHFVSGDMMQVPTKVEDIEDQYVV